jgi:hypothetical protein
MGARRIALGLALACAACGALLGADDDRPPGALTTTPDSGDASSPDAAPDVSHDACDAFDLTTDPRHCGSCDRDCLGTPCQAGVCAPQVLATPGFFNHLVVAKDRLLGVRVNGNGYRRLISIPKAAPSTPADELDLEPLAVDFDNDISGGVLFDATGTYWGTQSSIRRLVAGGVAQTLTSAVSVAGIVISGTELSWAQAVDPNGAVRHCTLPDCSAPVGGNVLGAVDDVVVLAGQRHFFERTAVGSNLEIEGNGVPVATAQMTPSRLVTDAARIYWAASDAFRAYTPPNTVTDVVPTPSLQDRFFSVTVDKTSIWLTRGSGVERCDRALPCSPKPYAATTDKVPAAADALAVDDDFVYWIADPGGKVVRVRKP